MSDFHATCNDAIAALLGAVREEAARGPVRPRVALFVEDPSGWRTIVIDGDCEVDLEDATGSVFATAVLRVAEVLGPEATAIVSEWPIGAQVTVGWRDASSDLYFVGRGQHEPVVTHLVDVLDDEGRDDAPEEVGVEMPRSFP